MRALRSTGTARDAKLRLARCLLEAGPGSLFPLRLRFLLDWLCTALKARGSEFPPCLDARYWRLLLELLCAEPLSVDAAAALAGSLREGLAQCNRLLLKAAAVVWEAVARESEFVDID